MLSQSELEARLRAWGDEFRLLRGGLDAPRGWLDRLFGPPPQAGFPDELWSFLAARFTEGGLAMPDPNVVRIQTPDGLRQVRVVGIQNGRYRYEGINGRLTWGLVKPDDILPADRANIQLE